MTATALAPASKFGLCLQGTDALSRPNLNPIPVSSSATTTTPGPDAVADRRAPRRLRPLPRNGIRGGG
eukprot:CAMPEP_0172542046 /NCGR_PEP_ID=MMETSP1067-20121228/12743_1 /TAXON_ID=265564 ORGANISM="Thalassiosira punctigera, Strain Tpunct2005C2" /NCGR_SAMPLE_ID=MMETSP1067 /ASSEMBLY_ACC=CAM_ASM_000444 /LENGTH=67 /DNA_ID=CAMNT_0013328207 /DNA_START=42 /DNA_END=242 /DNA_ORIENTATION=+